MNTMQMYIDLKQLLVSLKTDIDEIASLLFPKNTHPRAALNRVFTGTSLLDSNQMFRLSRVLNISVNTLYRPDTWSEIKLPVKQVFKVEDYTAYYYAREAIAYNIVFSNTDMTTVEFTCHLNLSMKDYLILVNNKIKKDEQS